MSNSINVKCKIHSNVQGTEVYALGIANNEYNVKEAANIQAFRTFVITNKGIDGIVKLTSNVTGQDVHQGEGDEEFQGTLAHCFANVDTTTRGDSVVVQDYYTNFVYSLVQDGLNRSLWDISAATKKFISFGTKTAANFSLFSYGSPELDTFVTLNLSEPTSPGKYVTCTNTKTSMWQCATFNQLKMENVPGSVYTFEIGNYSGLWGFGFLPSTYNTYDTVAYTVMPIYVGVNGWSSGQAFPNQAVAYIKVTVPQTLGDLNLQIYTDDTYQASSLFLTTTYSTIPGWYSSYTAVLNTSRSVTWKIGLIIHDLGNQIYLGNLQKVN